MDTQQAYNKFLAFLNEHRYGNRTSQNLALRLLDVLDEIRFEEKMTAEQKDMALGPSVIEKHVGGE